MYGLTEAFRSTYLPPEEVDRRPDSIGKAIPNAEILVLREDGTPCAPTSRASWCIAARWSAWATGTIAEKTAERYKPLPGREPASAPELAVFSGDTVRMDAEGFLYFIGRRDEMIKTSGYRVSPTEVEESCMGRKLVGEVARIRRASPRPRTGDRGRRDAKPTAALDVAALLAACRESPSGLHGPGRIEVRAGPLPRNPNGKIDRKGIAAEFTAGRIANG
jgi:acyl-coenzyme A synthetase/AMP-(fatty) acid ligase